MKPNFKGLPVEFLRAIVFENLKRNIDIPGLDWQLWSDFKHFAKLNENEIYRLYGHNDTRPIHLSGVCYDCEKVLRFPDGTRDPIQFGCSNCGQGRVRKKTNMLTILCFTSFQHWNKENRINLIKALTNEHRQ